MLTKNDETVMESTYNNRPLQRMTFQTRADAAQEMSDRMGGFHRTACGQRMYEDRVVTCHEYQGAEDDKYVFILTTKIGD